jgi:NitT/TauT family transport system permease protein
MKRFADLAPPLLLAALLLTVWETACRLLDLPVYFLPPPSAVALALVEAGPRLAASAWITFGMAVQALILAGLVGGGLALAVSLHTDAERAVRPLAVALQVTPVVAVAPLVLIWAGLDHADRAVIALAALVAFFPLFSGVLTGLKSADPDLERLFNLYGATPLQRLWRLRLPSAFPLRSKVCGSRRAWPSSAPWWPSSSRARARPKGWRGDFWRPAIVCARRKCWPASFA